MSSDLLGLPASRWAEAVRSGELDPQAGLEFVLARAEERNPELNALLGTDADGARSAAEAIRNQLARGEDPGPLAGVPFAIKNNIAVESWPLTCGSRILQDFRSPFTATVVQRLREAGAIPFAHANLDEFAMGASNENSAFGSVKNPFDPSRVPGGSSGGSAAATAAGFAPFSLGSETGGSVRQPASFCGLFGLKPTYGRFSRYGLVAFASSLDHIGVFGRSARDLALVFDAAAGQDERDATSLTQVVEACAPGMDRELRPLHVGIMENSFHDGVDEEVQAAVRRAAEALGAQGVEVSEFRLEHEAAIVPTYYLINTAEASANLARYDGVRYGARAEADDLQALYSRSREDALGAEVKRRILLGSFSLSAGYADQYFLAAAKARTLIVQAFQRALNDYDLLLSPTAPTPAFPLGEKVEDPVAMYLCDVFTAGANLAGVPAVNVPAGSTHAGLPIGVQLTAGHCEEAVLLEAAHALEQALGGALPVPANAGERA